MMQFKTLPEKYFLESIVCCAIICLYICSLIFDTSQKLKEIPAYAGSWRGSSVG